MLLSVHVEDSYSIIIQLISISTCCPPLNSLISPSLQQLIHFPLTPTIPSFPPHSNNSLISPSLQQFPHSPSLQQFLHSPLTPTIPSFPPHNNSLISPHSNNSLIPPSLQQFLHFPLTPTIPSFPFTPTIPSVLPHNSLIPLHSNNSLIPPSPSHQQFSLRFTHQIEATTKIVETRPLVINCSCCLV